MRIIVWLLISPAKTRPTGTEVEAWTENEEEPSVASWGTEKYRSVPSAASVTGLPALSVTWTPLAAASAGGATAT